jgi:hypothetical protein
MITLKTDYLKIFSVGTHKLIVVYADGECSANFKIKTAQEFGQSNKPSDSDTVASPRKQAAAATLCCGFFCFLPMGGVSTDVTVKLKMKKSH